MDTRLAPPRRRSLLFVLALLGSAGWTASSHAAAPSPLGPASESTEKVAGPALPWQFAPGLVVPGLMPEAYYTNTLTSTSTSTVAGKTTSGTTPVTPVTPYIPPNSPPDSAPEPGTLLTSLIGVSLLTIRIWRRRRTRSLVQAPAP
jgi:hypothetical protein